MGLGDRVPHWRAFFGLTLVIRIVHFRLSLLFFFISFILDHFKIIKYAKIHISQISMNLACSPECIVMRTWLVSLLDSTVKFSYQWNYPKLWQKTKFNEHIITVYTFVLI